jgi:hypothetical protein
MLATHIDVSDIRFDDGLGLYTGRVSMMLQPDRSQRPVNVHYNCTALQPRGCPSSLVVYGLIKDAVRQARRMPGFRRGEQQIEVDIASVSFAA